MGSNEKQYLVQITIIDSHPSPSTLVHFKNLKMMMMMITSLFALILAISLPNPTMAFKKSNHIFMVEDQNDLIERTCKNTPNYQLCVKTLESDPRSSQSRDVYELGLLLVDAVKDKASFAVENINRLKRSSNPELSLPLIECGILYNAILKADIPEAIEGLRKGVPKFAEAGMVDAALEVENCENSFKQPANSPLTEMNKDVYDLSLVAKSIIRMLL